MSSNLRSFNGIIKIMSILIYSSMIIWVLSGIRQFPTKYRYFFISIAISDPLNTVLVSFNMMTGNYVFLLTSLLAFYSTIKFDPYGKDKILYFLLPVLMLLTFFITGTTELAFVFIHVFIFYKVFKIATLDLFDNKHFGIFKYLLVFYELTVILNVTLRYIEATQYYFLFYATFAFQVLIGLFFVIFREDKTNLEIEIKMLREQN